MKRQIRNKKKIVLGITGSFGSGKTTVAKIFKSAGCKIIDADRIAHKLIKPKTKIYKKIVDTFGCGILKKNKTIDRYKLAKIVFDNRNLLNTLSKIIHPPVIRFIRDKIKTSNSKIIVLDAPLLIEAGLADLVDKLIVVVINRRKQIERILKKMPLNKTDVLKRIKYQLPLKEKVRLADFIIDNSGTIKETKKQVAQIRRRLWKN